MFDVHMIPRQRQLTPDECEADSWRRGRAAGVAATLAVIALAVLAFLAGRWT